MATKPTWGERVSGAWKALLGSVPQPMLRAEIALQGPLSYYGTQTRYNPSFLVSQKGLDIFKSMLRDDQVKAALTFKKRAALSSGWHICSPESIEADDDERAIFIQECFDELDGTFDRAVYEIASALDYGFSITEKVYEDRNGSLQLSALKTRDPRSWQFVLDPYGNVQALEQQPKPKADLPLGKFVHFTYGAMFNNPYGTSDLEAAYRPWFHKDNAYRYLGMLLERFGIPPMFGLYNPESYAEPMQRKLETIFNKLQAGSSGLIPRQKKDDLEMWSPELAGQISNAFIPAFQMYNQDIAKALLMPGLLGMTADNTQGSFARAQVHFDAFMLVVEDLRKELENCINEQIVTQLMLLNFPEREEGDPYFEFLPLTDDVRLELLNTWQGLTGSGVVTKQPEDERHIRELLKFPELDEAYERSPAPPPALPPTPDERPLGPPAQGAGGGDQPMTPKEREAMMANAKRWKKPTPKQIKKYQEQTQRPLTAAERRVNFAQVVSEMDGLEQEGIRKLKAVLMDTEAEYARLIREDLADGQLDTVTELTAAPNAGSVGRTLEGVLIEALGDGRAQVVSELGRVSFADYTPRDALEYLRTKAVEVGGILDARILGQVKQMLLTALKSGEPLPTTINRLQELFVPYTQATGESLSPFLLENIVRTNLTDALNQGRLAQARQADTGFVTGYLYSAIIDSRTTEVCQLLDGKFFDKDDPDIDRLTPPRHFSCRSILVPLTVDTGMSGAVPITEAEKIQAFALSGEGF